MLQDTAVSCGNEIGAKYTEKRQDRKTVYVYSNDFDPINLFEKLGN